MSHVTHLEWTDTGEWMEAGVTGSSSLTDGKYSECRWSHQEAHRRISDSKRVTKLYLTGYDHRISQNLLNIGSKKYPI